ncbi:MAG: DUF554 domain-containing protein [Clostridiales bacterium]|nr:DUF554 domain-containing protein [Clostridiales bacterium]
MLGVWVNCAVVVLGGLLGSFMKKAIPDRYARTINHGLALCVLVIGIGGALETQNMLIMIASVVLGTAAGTALKIEDRLNCLGDFAQRKLSKGDSRFAEGFVNATLLFGVGAMAVVGSLEAGLSNKPDTLLAKAALDGVGALIFASTFGPGVILSAIPLTLYQGGIALLAGTIAPFLTEELIREMSAVGSVLIIGLGLNMLGVMKDRICVGNMLPAMLVPVIYYSLAALL